MTTIQETLPTLAELYDTRRIIAPHLHRTPIIHSRYLSDESGYEVYLKAEIFQRTGSFKPRGMLAHLLNRTNSERGRGAITFSAGNAAQGLAYAGGIAGIPTVVVMPETASLIKAEATKGYGAEVILHGTAVDAYARCIEICEQEDLIFVPSFDDPLLMRGHASLGLEIAEDIPDVEAVIVGIGGGGMIGGLAMAREALRAKFRLYGVEPEGAAGMTLSLKAGTPVRLDSVATIADGLGAPFVGDRCFQIVRDHVAEVAVVSDAEIVNAMKILLARCKLLVEGAGASPVAALLSGAVSLQKGTKVCCVITGGNVDLDRLRNFL